MGNISVLCRWVTTPGARKAVLLKGGKELSHQGEAPLPSCFICLPVKRFAHGFSSPLAQQSPTLPLLPSRQTHGGQPGGSQGVCRDPAGFAEIPAPPSPVPPHAFSTPLTPCRPPPRSRRVSRAHARTPALLPGYNPASRDPKQPGLGKLGLPHVWVGRKAGYGIFI